VALMPIPPTPDRQRTGVSSHTTPNAAPQVGELKRIDRYHLVRLIARGGMSEVYLGIDPKTNRQVAVKLLSRDLTGIPSFQDRFKYEGRMSRALNHRNLVRGLDSGIDSETGRHFLVLELIAGPTAQQRLEQEKKLPLREAIRIALDIAHALEFLHLQNFVHRDIKPGNILLAPDGTAKLADLGVAKHLQGATDLTSFDQGIGTPYYMSWEQTLNASLVEPRSDLFSLGATLYHLLTGEVPFPGNSEAAVEELKRKGEFISARTLEPSIPRELDGIISRLLSKDHTKRFAHARELIEVLTASGLKDGELTELEQTQPADADNIPTQLDVENAGKTPIEEEAVWILCYRVKNGSLKRVRGRTRDVCLWIDEGLLPANTVAARDGQKRFRRLRDYPEFRPVVEAAEPKPKPKPRPVPAPESVPLTLGQISLICVAGAVSLAISAAALYCLFVRG
jgi:serine/threonine-protein kinase